jgi:hypothetical protein
MEHVDAAVLLHLERLGDVRDDLGVLRIPGDQMIMDHRHPEPARVGALEHGLQGAAVGPHPFQRLDHPRGLGQSLLDRRQLPGRDLLGQFRRLFPLRAGAFLAALIGPDGEESAAGETGGAGGDPGQGEELLAGDHPPRSVTSRPWHEVTLRHRSHPPR